MTDVDVGSGALLGDFALEGIILAQHVCLFIPDGAPNRYLFFYSHPLRREIIELHLALFSDFRKARVARECHRLFCLGRTLNSETMGKAACLSLTSKMSHDGNWRAACGSTIWIPPFHFESPEEARGVTGPGVGSGALLGGLGNPSGYQIRASGGVANDPRLQQWTLYEHACGSTLDDGLRSHHADFFAAVLPCMSGDKRRNASSAHARIPFKPSNLRGSEMPTLDGCNRVQIFHAHSAFLEITMSSATRSRILPNVKDEPRRERARLVPRIDQHSVASFRLSFGSTRRDRSRRWLWRLVGRFGKSVWISDPSCGWGSERPWLQQ